MNQIFNTDCLSGMQNLPEKSVNCCVTSPPYYGLRDYGHAGQIGLEKTPEAYVQNIVEVFREVKRVLKDDGTLWLNLGDSYASGKGTCYNPGGGALSLGKDRKEAGVHPLDRGNKSTLALSGLKPKDLIGIPWMVAFALRADGWYLRQDIIWHKPNPMPESVTDRCTKSHEYIFLMSKSKQYYYDHEAIKVDAKDPDDDLRRMGQQKAENKSMPTEKVNGLRPKSWNGSSFDSGKTGEMKHTRGGRASGNKNHKYVDAYESSETEEHRTKAGLLKISDVAYSKANKRSVWTVTTKPFSEAHFATFPEDLIVDCIKAGSPENGLILDPFMGAGTTAIVARKLNRNYVGFELNENYLKIAQKRLYAELGMWL